MTLPIFKVDVMQVKRKMDKQVSPTTQNQNKVSVILIPYAIN